jgi:lipopolysaccharide biosynthesis protein
MEDIIKISEKIIIFFHIYYIDLIDDYLWYLNNIKKTKYSFDLYVSLCKDVETEEIINKLLSFDSNIKITICKNRGADIGGFISSLRNYPINFDLYNSVLYLHTKKSITYGKFQSYIWRGQLLNDILINKELIEFCINEIKQNNVGIIGSSRCNINTNLSFLFNKKEKNNIEIVGNNKCNNNTNLSFFSNEKNHYDNLCNMLSLQQTDNDYFIAGTIFWSSPKIFKIIQNSSIIPDNFKEQFAHKDLLEHGFERIFGCISQNLNLSVLGIKLDIENPIYYYSFNILRSAIRNNNIKIFKILESIILPYENIIKKINFINKLKYIVKYR